MDKKKLSILIIIFIGLLTTVKLGFIYYDANFNPFALSSFCSINDFIDCDGIAKTTESQFLGVPLALWGFILYLFMMLMLMVEDLKKVRFLKFLEVFKNPMSYIAALGIISFTISMTLLGISLFEIKKLCILCAFTYVLNLLIGIIATRGIGFKNVFKDSVRDLIDGVKIKKYGIAFALVMLVFAGILTYTKTSYVLAPQVKRQAEFAEFSKAKYNKYAVSGNVLGNEKGDVIVYAYTDYRCPMCRVYDIMLHKVVREYSNVLIVHKNMPLDIRCNKYLSQEFHQDSCNLAKYAVAAEKQNKLWDMNNILFHKKIEDVKDVLKYAQKAGFDLDKLQQDANSFETMQVIQSDLKSAYDMGINGTPTTVINGKSKIGVKSYKELKKWLEDEGAK